MADIKRANNLLAEQDFFALRTVKIPVRRFSILTETHITGLHRPSSPSGPRRLPPIAALAAPPPDASTDSSSSSTDSVEGFLLEKDKDIEQLVKSTGPSRSSLNEVVSSLTLQPPPPPSELGYKPAPRKDPYYGADWGMRWWTAVAIMLVVGIVTPVFYLLYYEVLMKADASHHGAPTQPLHDGRQGDAALAHFHSLHPSEGQAGGGPGGEDGRMGGGAFQDRRADGEHGARDGA